MENGLSMNSRAEVTTKYAKAYVKAAKGGKGRILDEVVGVTGWSRENARRRLCAAARRPPGGGRQVAVAGRKRRSPKCSCDAVKVLQRVWAASGGQCGKYLAASMRLQLDGLERHGELVDGVDRYGPAVRGELLARSAASIDRYLRPAKATDRIRGVATTKPSALLRFSIKVRKSGHEVESEPGFFDGDTVAHCGPTLKGEFARTLNLTDVFIGWVFTRTVRNKANVQIVGALKGGNASVARDGAGWGCPYSFCQAAFGWAGVKCRWSLTIAYRTSVLRRARQMSAALCRLHSARLRS
jgi:hypothetical protein